MDKNGFALLGHDNPWGEYPAPVVPIGEIDKSLVAVYAKNDRSPDITILQNSVSFVRYQNKLREALSNFNYLKHRLFAFSDKNVTHYEIASENEFFNRILASPEMQKVDPFFRLSIAAGSNRKDTVVKEMISCLNHLRYTAPIFAGQWYEMKRQSLSQGKGAGLMLRLPQDWRELMANQLDTKLPGARKAMVKISVLQTPRELGASPQRQMNLARHSISTSRKRMSQSEVFRYFAHRTGMKRSQVKRLFYEMADLAVKELKSSGEFSLPGFGKLVKTERKVRKGRNPATGQAIRIPAKKTLKLRLGKAMKDTIAGKK